MAGAGTLQDLVAAAASLHCHRAAVTYDDGSASGSPPVSLRYADLLELAGELAQLLRDSCSPHNGVIGLCCCDDLFTPVWILGILQSPAAYVPLDPEAPGLLSAHVMNQCFLKYCVVKSDLLQRFQAALAQHMTAEVCEVWPKLKLTLIRVKPMPLAEQKRGTEPRAPAEALRDAGRGDLAYVLHTSGTTGLPKTVRVPHKCIVPNVVHLRSLFQVSADDVVFLASPLTFDPSVVEIFLALSSGAQLLIIPSVIKKTPKRLAQVLFKNHQTTVLQVTPTLLSRFGRRILKRDVLSPGSSLRVLAFGGESCPSPSLLSSWKHEDNRTHIYNIYGITEVSCWACCYEIPPSLLQPGNTMASSVPLGTPLKDTVVEVRDEHGCLVTEGEGQVFIGGEDRVCLLGDEEAAVAGTMRATGDWVSVRDSQLYYLGRRDRMIKRHGKRVDLDSMQHLISSLPGVEACAVSLYEGSRLLAFVVAPMSGGQSASSPPPSALRRAEQTLPASAGPGRAETGDAGSPILRQLSLLLPAYSLPDAVLLVPALPLTPHGKADMRALLKIYQRQRQSLDSESSRADITKLKQTLQSLWQGTLGLSGNAAVDEESNFLLSGGDSLKALRLCEDILATTGAAPPRLLELLLDGRFSDVLQHVAEAALTPPGENGSSAPAEAEERRADAASVAPVKRRRQDSAAVEATPQGAHDMENLAFKVLRRASEVMEVRNTERNKILQAGAASQKDAEVRVLQLGLSWSSDTGRCVDASPVILVREGADATKATAFIGSHSHRVQAVNLYTGSLLWERVLGGRIEASAAVSRCGRLVVIGCYDGGVYFLCAASGATLWTFETGDAVKSSPAVDPLTGLVVVGSHDGHVYALNPKVKRCVWRRHCGGGAVFSSPYLHAGDRRIYTASLGGHLLCLNADSGAVLWSVCRNVPFFSSPNASSGDVLIGSVDGNICCFSSAGKPLWQFLTKGPVFSSPCVTPDRQKVLCGSHDGRLYCLNRADGSVVWTFQASGNVYASPCVFDGTAAGWRGVLVGLASTDGTVWILDVEDGQMLASLSLPGELFSSPVVWGQSLVVGCRNDYLYCLKLTVKEET